MSKKIATALRIMRPIATLGGPRVTILVHIWHLNCVIVMCVWPLELIRLAAL